MRNRMKFFFSIFTAFVLVFFNTSCVHGTSPKPAEGISFQYKPPGHVFIFGKPVEFSVNGNAKGICRIYTYDRTKVFEQDLSLPGTVVIPGLMRGYYFVELSIPGSKEIFKSDFAVVTDPAKRNLPVDSAYCLDAALGGCFGPKVDEWQEISRLLGVKFARERFHQKGTEPVRGKYNWNIYGRAVRKHAENGTCLSAVLHEFAPWARKSKDLTFPNDLFTAYDWAKFISEKYRKEIRVWEIWNEPELLAASKEGPWEYTAMMKALCLGFKAGVPGHLITNGSHCTYPPDNLYAQAIVRNDLFDYTDIFNFHYYYSLSALPENIREWKKILRNAGVGDQIIWITEAGTRAEGYATVYPGTGPYRYLTPEQEMIWAECVPKLQILCQNLGVSRTFIFVLRPCHENNGKKEWGIIRRRDNSVKPEYAAFATLLDELGNAKCLGEVDLGKGIRGFLYQQPDRSRTLAFWSISELDTVANGSITFNGMKKKSFDIPGKEALLIDPFGTPHKLSGENGTVHIPSVRLVSYLRNAPDMKIKKAPEKEGVPGPRKRNLDRSVVLRIVPSKDFKLSGSRLLMTLNDLSKDKSMVIQVANFSGQAKKATVTVSGCDLPGFPAEVSLKPFSVAEIKTSAENLKPGKYTCTFAGKSNDLPISKMEFPFLITRSGASSSIPVAGSDKPENWKVNCSGKMEITFDEPNQSLRIDVDFSPKRMGWAYPIFKLPNGLPEDAKGLSFDIKVEVPGKKALYYLIFLKEKGKKARKQPYVPENHKWKHVSVTFDDLGIVPQNLDNFQIGLNLDEQNSATWFIRNIRLIK